MTFIGLLSIIRVYMFGKIYILLELKKKFGLNVFTWVILSDGLFFQTIWKYVKYFFVYSKWCIGTSFSKLWINFTFIYSIATYNWNKNNADRPTEICDTSDIQTKPRNATRKLLMVDTFFLTSNWNAAFWVNHLSKSPYLFHVQSTSISVCYT